MLTHPVVWQDLGFELTDTGGMFGASRGSRCTQLVVERGQRALQSADVIVFVVDGREGLVPGDQDIAARGPQRQRAGAFWRSTRPTIAARAGGALELYQLGFDPILEVSAEHGQGVGELLDEIVKRLPTRGAAAQPGRRRGRRRRDASNGHGMPQARPTRPRWRSSGVRTPASRRWSIGCCAKSG